MTTPRLGAYKINRRGMAPETVWGVLEVVENGTLTVFASRIVGSSNRSAPIRVYAHGSWTSVEEVRTDG